MIKLSENERYSDAEDLLVWLQRHFSSNCDGDWEHQYGVEITTTDNPGWHVSIDLEGTPQSDLIIPDERITRSEDDWIIIGVKNNTLFGAGGPNNIIEILRLLRTKMELSGDL